MQHCCTTYLPVQRPCAASSGVGSRDRLVRTGSVPEIRCKCRLDRAFQSFGGCRQHALFHVRAAGPCCKTTRCRRFTCDSVRTDACFVPSHISLSSLVSFAQTCMSMGASQVIFTALLHQAIICDTVIICYARHAWRVCCPHAVAASTAGCESWVCSMLQGNREFRTTPCMEEQDEPMHVPWHSLA
jgi:hypothetical protein